MYDNFQHWNQCVFFKYRLKYILNEKLHKKFPTMFAVLANRALENGEVGNIG